MDDATRAALASGRAEPSLALLIDTFMSMRGAAEPESDAIAGAAFEAEAATPISPDALDAALAAIARAPREPQADLVHSELHATPPVLQQAIRAAESRRGWNSFGPGIRILPLALGGEAKAEVLRVEPGVAIPWHTHKGLELTLCLIGEYTDRETRYGPGDVSIADPSIRHSPKAHEAGPVYALSVTDAGLKFEGLLGVLQKLFRF